MKEAHYRYATLPLVVPTRIELVMVDYQSTVIPFNYRTMVVPVGIEPTSTVLQTAAMTTSAKAPLGCLTSTDLVPTLSQRAMLPLHHRHHWPRCTDSNRNERFWRSSCCHYITPRFLSSNTFKPICCITCCKSFWFH